MTMQNDGGVPTDAVDSAPEMNSDFTAEELAQIADMERSTPMPKGEGESTVSSGGEPSPKSEEPKADDPDLELEEGEAEIAIDGSGKARNAAGQFVSKSALLREKERYKSTRDENAKLRETIAAGDARLKMLMDLVEAQPEAPAQKAAPSPLDEPDIDAQHDPLGAVQQANRRTAFMAKLLKDSQESQTKRDTAMNEQQREQAIVNAYKADSQRFYQQEPSFKDAWAFVFGLRHEQLKAVGIEDESARNQIIAQEERGIVHESMRHKRSPAEAIYKLAVASGFKKQGAEPSAAAKKLAEVQRGQETSKSLSAGGGGAPVEGVTMESVANMSDEQFSAFHATVAGKRKLQEWGFL